MTRTRRRWARLVVSAAIISAGVLPASCATRFRDATIAGLTGFTTTTVSTVLGRLVPVDQFFPAR